MSGWFDQRDNPQYAHEQIVQLMQGDLGNKPDDPWGHKSKCIRSMNFMGEKLNEEKRLGLQISALEDSIGQMRASADEKKQELQGLKNTEGDLQRTKIDKDNEWQRSRMGCEESFVLYDGALRQAMKKQAPDKYAESCEKVCMDFAGTQGCGVVEGNTVPLSPGEDVTGTGQVRPKCKPPAMSWVLAPYSYMSDEELTNEARQGLETEQCGRIFSEQQPTRAQVILKSGNLWKRERLWRRWRQRFFALESGDEARSGILRYWRDRTQDERVKQGIILWDAKDVKAKRGSRYGWRDGTECFKVYHFYRDYRLCAEGRDAKAEIEGENGWVALIKNEIRFPRQRNED